MTTKPNKIVKDQVIAKLVEKTQLSKKNCESVCEALSEVILEALSQKSSIIFGTLGQFKYKYSSERECKSITTGEKITVQAKGGGVFAFGKKAKESLSKVL